MRVYHRTSKNSGVSFGIFGILILIGLLGMAVEFVFSHWQVLVLVCIVVVGWGWLRLAADKQARKRPRAEP